jgi:hypothetical protein
MICAVRVCWPADLGRTTLSAVGGLSVRFVRRWQSFRASLDTARLKLEKISLVPFIEIERDFSRRRSV